jgi:hypothetical protein
MRGNINVRDGAESHTIIFQLSGMARDFSDDSVNAERISIKPKITNRLCYVAICRNGMGYYASFYQAVSAKIVHENTHETIAVHSRGRGALHFASGFLALARGAPAGFRLSFHRPVLPYRLHAGSRSIDVVAGEIRVAFASGSRVKPLFSHSQQKFNRSPKILTLRSSLDCFLQIAHISCAAQS